MEVFKIFSALKIPTCTYNLFHKALILDGHLGW